MNTPKTEQLIEETLGLDERATKGPWCRWDRAWEPFGETEIRKQAGGTMFRSTSYGHARFDCDFIAHTRTAAPLLARQLKVAIGALNKLIPKTPSMNGRDGWSLDARLADDALAEIERIAGESGG